MRLKNCMFTSYQTLSTAHCICIHILGYVQSCFMSSLSCCMQGYTCSHIIAILVSVQSCPGLPHFSLTLFEFRSFNFTCIRIRDWIIDIASLSHSQPLASSWSASLIHTRRMMNMVIVLFNLKWMSIVVAITIETDTQKFVIGFDNVNNHLNSFEMPSIPPNATGAVALLSYFVARTLADGERGDFTQKPICIPPSVSANNSIKSEMSGIRPERRKKTRSQAFHYHPHYFHSLFILPCRSMRTRKGGEDDDNDEWKIVHLHLAY